jgi:predicted dehydrogenase
MSHGHARAVLDREDSTLVAIADPSDRAMDSFVSGVVPAGLEPPARFHDLEALISHGIDALVIVTPHTQHASQIERALVSGIHVLCEKPLATTAADA